MVFSPEARRGGGLPFGQFVCQWICDPRYSTNLRTLYGILVTYADIGARDTKKGKPYRKHLAKQLGCSEKTLDRTLLEGECAGLLWVEKRKNPGNSAVNDANIYHLRDAEFWRGEWEDPLAPGQQAADVANALLAKRAADKAAAGIKPRGGRKKRLGGVPSPMTPPPGGGPVTHDATPPVTHDATPPVTHDAPYLDPSVETHSQEPQSFRPSVPAGRITREAQPDGRTDGSSGIEVQEHGLMAAGGAAA
ncbi:hypothetical protein, partial [Streptomyces sp. NPDC045369]|uniref:hypothetical protein n=1 Tax=Streptomyces sp. NPDC045369 TaxID=3155732 RepID=UPI0034109A3B